MKTMSPQGPSKESVALEAIPIVIGLSMDSKKVVVEVGANVVVVA